MTTLLVLSAEDVRQSLPMPEAIQAMKRALILLSRAAANIPPRTHLTGPRGTTLVMPGQIEEDDLQALIVKVVSVFNQNHQRGLPNILGMVNVFDPETGAPAAVLNGSAITALRTAAASAAATDCLARPDASHLAIIGAGALARTHFAAIREVRPIERVSVYAPRPQKVRELLDELPDDVEKIAAGRSAEATSTADIVCAVTNSSRPVIEDTAIAAGTHINAVGSYRPEVVEIPAATMCRARIFVDHRSSVLEEAGDLIQPIRRGLLSPDAIAGEVGQVLEEQVPGRTEADEVTLFKSVGNTIEDVLAAHLVLQGARRMNLGQRATI